MNFVITGVLPAVIGFSREYMGTVLKWASKATELTLLNLNRSNLIYVNKYERRAVWF